MSGYGAGKDAPGAKCALRISGYAGVHADQVNAVYEPLGNLHNGKPCWGARIAMGNAYIHHTGKGRWVINKRLDTDGSRCYAFITDDGGNDPTDCKGKWSLAEPSSGNWREEPKMTCTMEQASSDIFVKLRARVEKEMRDFGLTDNTKLKQLWRQLDKNGNGVVSLAEIDCLVVDMTKAKTWPAWINNKQALQRAYQKTTKVDGCNDDDWVQKNEFHALLLNIFWFAHLHEIFDTVDSNDDKKINLSELKAGMQSIGLHLGDQEATSLFQSIDRNHGGDILFVEFCEYVRKRVCPDHNPQFDRDLHFGEHAGARQSHHDDKGDKAQSAMSTVMRGSQHGDKSTAGHFVQKKNLGAFDDLEKKIKSHFKDNAYLKKLWRGLDFDNNQHVSLAEIDKMVVESYPLLNHKPALMRAYKATIGTKGERDGFVHQKDLKCLILNLFYFNKLFWLFDHVDEDKDRRMNFEEFKWCLSVAGCKMSDPKAKAEFQKVDKNEGGIILFDEFCKYFTKKQCPGELTAFVA